MASNAENVSIWWRHHDYFVTAGFPAIDRSHTYHLTESSGFSYPIIFMQPPDASVAGFSDATVDNVEIYLKSEGRVTFVSMQSGIFVMPCYSACSALSKNSIG